jgi:superfamily I DNA and/or RNA helicase
MALVALYLGKTVLVVGDHEQVSPSAVGQDLDVIQNVIFQYLRGIPNADLYDGQISIYDLARQSFGGTTCLVEHFRCVPEIIQFSNMISYDGRIKPSLRREPRPTAAAHHCTSRFGVQP